MAKVTEEQVRKALLKQLKATPNISSVDLFYEVDYKLRVGHTYIQRVLFSLMGDGVLRLGPGLRLTIV